MSFVDRTERLSGSAFRSVYLFNIATNIARAASQIVGPERERFASAGTRNCICFLVDCCLPQHLVFLPTAQN